MFKTTNKKSWKEKSSIEKQLNWLKMFICFIVLELLQIATLWHSYHKRERFEYYYVKLERCGCKKIFLEESSNNFAFFLKQKLITITRTREYFRKWLMITIRMEFFRWKLFSKCKAIFRPWENGHCSVPCNKSLAWQEFYSLHQPSY